MVEPKLSIEIILDAADKYLRDAKYSMDCGDDNDYRDAMIRCATLVELAEDYLSLHAISRDDALNYHAVKDRLEILHETWEDITNADN